MQCSRTAVVPMALVGSLFAFGGLGRMTEHIRLCGVEREDLLPACLRTGARGQSSAVPAWLTAMGSRWAVEVVGAAPVV